MAKPVARLFVEADLAAGAVLGLAPAAAHYLAHVLRAKSGEAVLVFNGRDGEWRARIEGFGRRARLAVGDPLRRQRPEPDLWLAFAPIKRAPIDRLVQMATELGAAKLIPVFTRFTAVARVNVARLRANSIEAAEQCGRLTVPAVAEPIGLAALVHDWPSARPLLVLDETGQGASIGDVLAGPTLAGATAGAILAGPEGGFAAAELDALHVLPFVSRVRLGPRILRADTAALAALACWQAWIGDWRDPPRRAAR